MKAIHLFLETNICCGHDGLLSMASKKGVDVEALAPGSAIFFFNKNLNKVKVLSPNGVLAYARFEAGITLEALNAFSEAVTPGLEIQIPRLLQKKILSVIGNVEPKKTQQRQAA